MSNPVSLRNNLKYSSNGVSSSITQDLAMLSPQIVFNEPLVQSTKNEKYNFKSRICTGLTPRIERRNQTSEIQPFESDTSTPKNSIPPKDYKSHTGLLDQGIYIRKLGNKIKNNPEKIESYTKKHKNKEISSSSNTNDILDPHTPFRDSFLIIQKSKLGISEIQVRNKRDCKTSLKKPEILSERNTSDSFNSQLRRKNPKKVEKVSVKDAIRDKEWVSKAKPQIFKSFYLQVNKSNGMGIELGTDSFFSYKYYLGKGNNSNLIKQCLSTRWWWTRVSEEDIKTANLIWTQWKDKKTLDSLPKLTVNPVVQSKLGVTITTSARYMSPNSNSRPKPVDISLLGYNFITRSKSFVALEPTTYKSAEMRLHNKIEHNFHLSNKKALYFNLKAYYDVVGEDVFEVIPVTFHIKGLDDPSLVEFEACYKSYEELTDDLGRRPANLWIVKPGENSNRGNGIAVCTSLEQIKQELKTNPHPKTGKHTFIVQKYIEKPFLINKRKFDIRCFCLVTSFNGIIQAYFFNEGYLRTASKAFSLSATNKFIHLTNDAVQKHSDDYGKFENGNKMSYNDFQKYLDAHYSEKSWNFFEEVLPKMKKIIKNTIEAVFVKLDPNLRGHSFEIFGYDFLLDCDLKPWLLEVNTNPCLEVSSPHLARIIPSMLDNSFRICLDPVFQEPTNHTKHMPSLNDLAENKYELIFHSVLDGEKLVEKFRNAAGLNQAEIEELSNEADEDLEGSESEEV